jgi:hypothetical protein
MLEITPNNVANATKRARGQRPKVRRLSDTEIAVTCRNSEHPGGHVARFERRADGSLWGECVLAATGELCPAALGRNVCYHLSAGAALFLALEERSVATDRDGATEHAVTFDGAMPRPAGEVWNRRFDCRRTTRAPEPDAHPDAVLVAPPSRRKVERVGGFQI